MNCMIFFNIQNELHKKILHDLFQKFLYKYIIKSTSWHSTDFAESMTLFSKKFNLLPFCGHNSSRYDYLTMLRTQLDRIVIYEQKKCPQFSGSKIARSRPKNHTKLASNNWMF